MICVKVLAAVLIVLCIICVNTEKVKRQATFSFGFENGNKERQELNFGQFLGGLFGGLSGQNQGNNQNKNPIGGLFDAISSISGGQSQNQFRPPNLGINFGSQGCSFNNGGCQHGCRMIRGRKQCYCRDGYHIHNADGSCHDDNECEMYRPCQERCENTEGSYICHCSRGAVQPDGTCRSNGGFTIIGSGGNSEGNSDTSCTNNNGGCEQVCMQQRGGVQCHCSTGYLPSQQNPNACVDFDECSTGQHNCKNRCVNTIGSFSCQGISFPIGTSPPVQTCSTNNGGCEFRCRESQNGVSCRCRRSFILDDDNKSCVCRPGFDQVGNRCRGSSTNNNNDKINCAINNGGCEQKCRTKRRGDGCVCNKKNFKLQMNKKSCECKKGFELSTNGKRCLDPANAALETGPCDVNNGGCQHLCKVVQRRSVCTCNSNFDLRADKKSCLCRQGLILSRTGQDCIEKSTTPKPINPCAVNKGGCHHNCRVVNINQPQCYCNDLYSLAPDGISCIPVDPCTVINGGCDHTCTNKNSKAICTCKSGWQLMTNGRSCIEIPSPTQTTTKPRTGCGVNNKKDLLRRIVGGKPADPKDWPWMAAILRKRNSDQFCGGVLITDRHILTASHCLVDFKKEDLLVRLGEYDFSSTTENNPTDFAVVDIRLHENYNRSSQENDIAIMKLDKPSTFSEFVWPVCLPPGEQEFRNQLGYVTGWGTTSFGGKISRVLQEVVVPVWAQNDCSSAYPNKILSSMMCAGLREGGKDSCQGDSGGPFLVQIYPSSRWFVIGVVSWGIKCAEAGNPGVYTRVNNYLPWIRANAVF